MTYLYTQANRLEDPHNYMYTPFEGTSLIQSYQTDRLSMLQLIIKANYSDEASNFKLETCLFPFLERSFDSISQTVGDKFRSLLPYKNDTTTDMVSNVKNYDSLLPEFTITTSIKTHELLQELIATQLTEKYHTTAKKWLDRLIQRFEVTKKIYEIYPAGFRKGEGAKDSVRLYWLFALSLGLYYVDSQQIKYLSTLLKVCDLLCSLPKNLLCDEMSSKTMATILATEIVSVQILAEKQGA